MSDEQAQSEPDSGKRSAIRTALLYVGICFGLCFVSAVSFGLGMGTAQLQGYSKQYHTEKSLIEPFLASDPAFKELECRQQSDGGVYPRGGVPKQADLDRLREQIIGFVGERRAGEITSGVRVLTEQ